MLSEYDIYANKKCKTIKINTSQNDSIIMQSVNNQTKFKNWVAFKKIK